MSTPVLDKLPFTLQCLPFGVISTKDSEPRCAVAIGDHAIDLVKYAQSERIAGVSKEGKSGVDFEHVFKQPVLNTFAALDWKLRIAVREQLQRDLENGNVPEGCLLKLDEVKQHLPMQMQGFSDFYTSLEHCQNCSGQMAEAKIPKNWFYAPSVYNSRVSSVLPTPSTISRPSNVYFSNGIDSEPTYGPTKKLDFELEMGYFLSKPIPWGERLAIKDAKEHIFGFVLLNDWSARDHQLFEMRPLGPFHSKGFGTSISNWIVPLEALEPFSCAPNTPQNPPPFPHLTWPNPANAALDIKLRVTLIRASRSYQLSTSNLKYMYWTPYQQLTHHAASGCGMATGDLIGTGTISGSGVDEQGGKVELGCLYEVEMTGGVERVMPQGVEGSGYQVGYLEDGDEVLLEGWCEDGGGRRVLGFGECRGRVGAPK